MPDGGTEKSVEKSKVVLVGFTTDQDRYVVVKKLSLLLGLTYEEAADLAQQAPVDLVPSVPTEAAENLAEKLEKTGAVVEVLPLLHGSRFCRFHPHRGARARCRSCREYICDLCLLRSRGKLYCAEHFENLKQKQVLKWTGGVFLSLLVVSALLYFRNDIRRIFNYYSPVKQVSVSAVFVSEHPSPTKSKYFLKTLESTPRASLDPNTDHVISDIPLWFDREYVSVTGKPPKSVLKLSTYGFYKISIPPPLPPDASEFSYAAMKQHRDYTSYFEDFLSKNRLKKPKAGELVILIDLVENTRLSRNFMEELGSAAGRYAYVKLPISDDFAPGDYYIATVIHFIARAIGAKAKLTEKGFPKNPEGLADPTQVPRYAQAKAEIMACYRPIREFTIERPAALMDYVIGPLTAYELGWLPYRSLRGLY